MILFLLLSVPLTYMFVLSTEDSVRALDQNVRNPIVAGACAYIIWLLVDFAVGGAFNSEYLWKDSYIYYSVYDQIIPIALALVFFVVFLREHKPGFDTRLALLSYLAVFFLLLSIEDLVRGVNQLDDVVLFARPVSRVVILVTIPALLDVYRRRGRSFPLLALDLLVTHVLLSAGTTAIHMNSLIPGLILFVLPLVQALLILFRPGLVRGVFNAGRVPLS